MVDVGPDADFQQGRASMVPRVIATAAAMHLLVVDAGPARSQSPRPFVVKTPDGINISAQEWGNPNGREIVFIHGFMQSHLSWSKQIRDPGLAKQFRMISYDFRGHGGSDKIMEPNLYGNGEAYAEELNAVIAAASLRRPVLVGWSYGTRIISDYLVRFGSVGLAGINFVGAIPRISVLRCLLSPRPRPKTWRKASKRQRPSF